MTSTRSRRLLILLMVLMVISGTRAVITCTAVTTRYNTSVTCHFGVDVSKSRQNFNVQFYYPDLHAQPKIVLMCNYVKTGELKCPDMPNVTFNQVVSDQIRLTRPASVDKVGGQYVCQLVPRLGNAAVQPCELTYKEISTTPFPTSQPSTRFSVPHVSGENYAVKINVILALLVVLILLVVSTIIALILWIKRERVAQLWAHHCVGRAVEDPGQTSLHSSVIESGVHGDARKEEKNTNEDEENIKEDKMKTKKDKKNTKPPQEMSKRWLPKFPRRKPEVEVGLKQDAESHRPLMPSTHCASSPAISRSPAMTMAPSVTSEPPHTDDRALQADDLEREPLSKCMPDTDIFHEAIETVEDPASPMLRGQQGEADLKDTRGAGVESKEEKKARKALEKQAKEKAMKEKKEAEKKAKEEKKEAERKAKKEKEEAETQAKKEKEEAERKAKKEKEEAEKAAKETKKHPEESEMKTVV